MTMPRLGIVLVNWNGWIDTVECLISLTKSSVSIDVVVVDNHSSDESVERIRLWALSRYRVAVCAEKECTAFSSDGNLLKYTVEHLSGEGSDPDSMSLDLIRSDANLGFAGGNNLGIELLLARAGIDYVWLLNNDTVVEPEAAASLIKRMDEVARVGLCGTIVRYYHNPKAYQALNGSTFCVLTGASRCIGAHETLSYQFDPDAVAKGTDFVLGASLGVSRGFIEEIGFMDDRYFLYFEEIDWSYRNRGKFRIAFADKSIVYHKEGGSIGSNSNNRERSGLSDYYMLRSRLKFIKKHAPFLLPLHWSLAIVQIARRLVRRNPGKAVTLVRALIGVPFK